MSNLVNVIVPVYNVETYLRQCVDSIINQTYQNLSIILVDDGSTDDSGNICEEYKQLDSRVKVIHQANAGLSQARNSGIDAIGDLSQTMIMFVDSDDFLELDAIEKLQKVMAETDSDIVRGQSFTLNEEEGMFGYYGDLAKLGEVSFYDSEEAMRTLPVMVHAMLYRGHIFETVRYPVGRLHEDNWTTPRTYWLANRIAFLHENIYCYRLRKGSITTETPSIKRMEDSLMAVKSEMIDWYFAGIPTLPLERDLYSITNNYMGILKHKYSYNLPPIYYELAYTNKSVKASIERQEKELELNKSSEGEA